jgi:WD40 repeat protein
VIVDQDADGVRGLALSADAKRLAAVDDAGWLRIWDLASDAARLAAEGPTGLAMPHAVTIAADGAIVVVGEGGGAILSAKAEPLSTLTGRELQSVCIVGARLLVAGDDGRLRLLERSGKVVAEAKVGERNAGIAIEGERVAVAASWQGGSELLVARLHGDSLAVRSEPRIKIAVDTLSAVAISGTRALLPARDLCVYDLDSGQLIAAFDPKGQPSNGAPGSILLESFWSQAASLGGGRFAAASPEGGAIFVVDAKTAAIVARHEHPEGVTALAGAAGVLASAGLDRTLRVWR